MADDITNDKVEEVVEAPSQPAPEEQEVQEEPEQVEATVEEAPQEQSEEEAPEERPPSRREQLRVQDLLKKYGPPREAPSQPGPDFRSQVAADEDVYKTLEETAQQYGQAQFNQGLSQAEFTSWQRFLQMEERQIRSKFPMLDPSNKETYHEAVDKSLQGEYLQFVGFDAGDPQRGIAPSVRNPNVSYLDYVEARFEFADELASQKNARTTQNIAKQAASTGLRPDGSSAKSLDLSKDPTEMTDEELKAMVNATMPRDSRGRFTKSQ